MNAGFVERRDQTRITQQSTQTHGMRSHVASQRVSRSRVRRTNIRICIAIDGCAVQRLLERFRLEAKRRCGTHSRIGGRHRNSACERRAQRRVARTGH